ncbi:MAG: DUF1667 domain-containing protein [Erysipelotrichaceae bacterium]|nr:DUF1667 domain-containing protein [Erysipelotrichaceae bacterium]MBO4537803.1 DUF1667 domain-containing protein [Erysipelotrichaceae bacterium]MBR5048352.1 DUF1667 domain-containing protein [Erysipelotrichaceae bacterium]
MTELICIGCPRGCHLKVDEQNGYAVSGNSCPVGAEYGKNELTNPTRVLTSTVRITGAIHSCLPVKSSGPIRKALLMDAVQALKDVEVASPVHKGDVIVRNIVGSGQDMLASRDM